MSGYKTTPKRKQSLDTNVHNFTRCCRKVLHQKVNVLFVFLGTCRCTRRCRDASLLELVSGQRRFPCFPLQSLKGSDGLHGYKHNQGEQHNPILPWHDHYIIYNNGVLCCFWNSTTNPKESTRCSAGMLSSQKNYSFVSEVFDAVLSTFSCKFSQLHNRYSYPIKEPKTGELCQLR